MVLYASGAGQDSVYNTPNWAIGYKTYDHGGQVDGGGTFAGVGDTTCHRVVIPYVSQHYMTE
jgi:hypothetical protein